MVLIIDKNSLHHFFESLNSPLGEEESTEPGIFIGAFGANGILPPIFGAFGDFGSPPTSVGALGPKWINHLKKKNICHPPPCLRKGVQPGEA